MFEFQSFLKFLTETPHYKQTVDMTSQHNPRTGVSSNTKIQHVSFELHSHNTALKCSCYLRGAVLTPYKDATLRSHLDHQDNSLAATVLAVPRSFVRQDQQMHWRTHPRHEPCRMPLRAAAAASKKRVDVTIDVLAR